MCTIFHWDYPEALYKRGGWLNRDSADWFAEYTALLADKFSDRVKLWVTQNEPQCFIGLGHLDGVHAPGDKLKFSDYLLAAHNGMRAHAKSVQALRAHAKDPKATKIGYVLAAQITQPASDKPEDVEAARAAIFAVNGRHEWNNAWWTDPVVLGKYPEDGVAEYGKDMPKFKPSDLDEMKQPIDFLGPQHLQGRHVSPRRGRQARASADPGWLPARRLGLADDHARVAVLGAALLLRSLQAAAVDHRERAGGARPGVPGRQGSRSAAHRLHAPLPGRARRARSRRACR